MIPPNVGGHWIILKSHFKPTKKVQKMNKTSPTHHAVGHILLMATRNPAFENLLRLAVKIPWDLQGFSTIPSGAGFLNHQQYLYVVVSNIVYLFSSWGRFPFWLICFIWVETTNQVLNLESRCEFYCSNWSWLVWAEGWWRCILVPLGICHFRITLWENLQT